MTELLLLEVNLVNTFIPQIRKIKSTTKINTKISLTSIAVGCKQTTLKKLFSVKLKLIFSFPQELRQEIESVSTQVRELLTSTRRTLSELGQALPPDTSDKLASVELQAEKTQAELEDTETEHKKAKNVRYEFQVHYVLAIRNSN